jgi:SMI1 / KNR4 family (SUKH-1)
MTAYYYKNFVPNETDLKKIDEFAEHIKEKFENPLPLDYLYFLRRSGGGELKILTEDSIFADLINIKSPFAHFGKFCVYHLFGLSSANTYAVEDYFNPSESIKISYDLNLTYNNIQELMLDYDVDITQYVTIAWSGNQGWFLLSLADNDYGNVVYFNTDYGEYEDKIIPVSSSFTSFIGKIISDNGGYIKNLSEIYEDMLKQGF